MMKIFEEIKTVHKGEFMAFKQDFIEDNYTYIRSAKMIAFHVTMMLIAIFGIVISVKAFPSIYGRK